MVNNDGREYLMDCLAAIEKFHPAGLESEVLVPRQRIQRRFGRSGWEQFPSAEVIAMESKQGKAANTHCCWSGPGGRYCLL